MGSGAGKILKGAGQGIGHVFGGGKFYRLVMPDELGVRCQLTSYLIYLVAGGAVQVGKGIGKGIIKGDGNAVVQGLTKGVSSVGGGIAQGAETAVMGAADGFLSAGKGLFSGVRNVGRGAVNAVQGKRYEKKSPQR